MPVSERRDCSKPTTCLTNVRQTRHTDGRRNHTGLDTEKLKSTSHLIKPVSFVAAVCDRRVSGIPGTSALTERRFNVYGIVTSIFAFFLKSARARIAQMSCAILLAHCLTPQIVRAASILSDPQVDSYNVRVGTQTFDPRYHFTSDTLLVETANAITNMGSDIIKMEIAPGYASKYNIPLGSNISNLVTLVRDEPSCRRVFDMPFRHYVLWTYPFSSWWPFDGYSSSERSSEYTEFYNLTCYLLTNYNNSGKTFYLGHWEGDGYLKVNNWTTNPSPTMVQGFIDCLNNRQKAIDDAKAATAFTNVNVFCYAEANRVRDAMLNDTNNNVRMINAVIPYVTNLDYVSYSSYDMQRLSDANKQTTLDYMESMLPTNKAHSILGERIWIGEYGYASGGDTPAQQEPETRAYIQFLLNYGIKGISKILFWEMYDNETNADGSYKYFYLIDPNNNKTPCYYLHQRFINDARLLAAQFKETNGRLPNDSEFAALVTPMLDAPLAAPVNLTVNNLAARLTTNTAAMVSGTLAQGVYGDEEAGVWVFYGRQDGGTNPAAWESSRFTGVNTNFNPATFAASLSNLTPNTNYYYRFYAANSANSAWSPASSQFSTTTITPSDYGCRMKLTFTGYNRGETLSNFPALVNLNTNLPGFSYRQFASPSGGDLRITDSGGVTPIPFEIDEWNTSGTSVVWVSLPSLSTINDSIWLYWGNPAATNLPASSTNGDVWSDYDLVWHLKESAFPYNDSSQKNPALSGVAPTSAAGIVGRGSSFNGSSQYLNAGVINVGTTFSLSAWLNLDSSAGNIQCIWANKPAGWNSSGFGLFANSYNTTDGKLLLETGDGTSGITATTIPGVITSGHWHCVTAVVNETAGAAQLYVDGTNCTSSSAIASDFPNQSAINLGRFTNSTYYLKGTLDDVRIGSGLFSSNWIWASWMTVASNTTLATYSVITQSPPELRLTKNGNILTLNWPASGVGFGLFSATNLIFPITWTLATNQPAFASNQWQISLPIDNAAGRFYRLKSQ